MGADAADITPFERGVLDLILDGTSQEARILQEQSAVAQVAERGPPGRGTGIWFEVPDYAPRLPARRNTTIANLCGRVSGRDGASCDAFFLLHVCEGELAMLECIGSGPAWPEHPQLQSHYYTVRGREGLILPG